MSSLVEELQRDALDRNVSVSDLLNKCLVVARKLKQKDFEVWVHRELDGYQGAELPPYRVLQGSPKVLNPYRGYQPLQFPDAKQARKFSTMHFDTPIGQIERQLQDSKSNTFAMSYQPEVQQRLIESIHFNLEPSLHFNASQMQGIVDAVRKIILEWSLKLEQDGIVGTGMSFSRQEKELAQTITYNIRNFVQGDISQSQLQIETTESVQNRTESINLNRVADLISTLRDAMDAMGLNQEQRTALQREVEKMEEEAGSSTPNESALRESIRSVRRVLEGAAGNLVASGLLNQLGAIFCV